MSNLLKALTPRYPDDIEKIYDAIPGTRGLSPTEAEKVWQSFSDDFAAGWLTVDEETLKQFQEWLNE